ncbi:MAG TPA: hypothetical protein VGJ14_12720 [Sporichthyaceae bacterium]|jgi:hypothetical protein
MPSIKWASLWQVAEVSFAATVSIVVLFTLAAFTNVLALQEGPGIRRGTHQLTAALCYSAIICSVAYGIYLIVPQFHK